MTTSKPKPRKNIKDEDSKIIRKSILTVLIDHLEAWLAGISSQALPCC